MAGLLRNAPAPEGDGHRTNFPIWRCDRRSGFKVNAYVLSLQTFGVNIHYAGRTVPCTAPDKPCRLCEDERAIRWVGFLAACNVQRTQLGLLEITPGCASVVKRGLEKWETLRGCYATLTRPSMKDTGRLHLELAGPGQGCDPGDLPEAFDVEATLCRIWALDKPDPEYGLSHRTVYVPGESYATNPTMRSVVCDLPPADGSLFELAGELPAEANGRAH